MKTVCFFNNKGGVGKTSLVYHIAWMMHELDQRVVVADLDPQANLTSAFLNDDEVEALWPDGDHPRTIAGALDPLLRRLGDLRAVEPQVIADGLSVLPGDLGLSAFEDRVSDAWRQCLSDQKYDAEDAFRVMTAFYRAAAQAADATGAEYVLIDVGPNIGAMNRAALVAADYVVIPLGADLFSLQGLRNLGPTLREWRSGWQERRSRPHAPASIGLAPGSMTPLGYVVLNPSVRSNRPVKAYAKWAGRIPSEYQQHVVGSDNFLEESSNELALIKHFKSLMPMAQEARKPMFLLTAADGAIGGHMNAVMECRRQFESLARKIIALVRG